MLKLQNPITENALKSRRKIYLPAILLLVTLFLIFQFLLAYVLSIWDNNKIETTLSTSLHRKVHLGKISWHMGIQGLAFVANEITVEDKDQTPFFHANKTTILFGIIPLLRGQLRVKHLDMREPEIWVKRLSQTEWNFSDLPQSETFSKFADCEVKDGRLKLIDKRPSINRRFAEAEFQHIQLATYRPFGKYFWPFSLSAEFEQPEGPCEISLKGKGMGSFNELQNCDYSFILTAHNFAPINLKSFIDSIPETEGCMDIELKGSCIPSSRFEGSTYIKTEQLSINHPITGQLKLLRSMIQAKVSMNKKQIKWQDLVFKIAESEIRSEGIIDQWLSGEPTYSAKLDGHTQRLDSLLKNIDAQFVRNKVSSLPKDFTFTGKLDLSGSLAGNFPNQKFINEVSLRDASVKLSDRNFILSAINGSIKSDINGLHVKQVKGALNGGSVEVIAEMPLSEKNTIRIKGTNVAVQDIKALTALASVPSILDRANLHGKIQSFDLVITENAKQPKINLVLNPTGMILEGQNHDSILKINDGIIIVNDDDLDLNKLKGNLGKGNFFVDGHVGLNTIAPFNVQINAQQLDLSEGRVFMQSMGVDNSLFNEPLFSGKIQELKLTLTGTPKIPRLNMYIVPDDICYKCTDANKAMHLMSGVIKCQSGILTLDNVNLKGQSTKCQISAKISHCFSKPVVEQLSINNANIDLGEITSCLLDKKNTQHLRHTVKGFLDPYGISDIQGQLVGNMSAKNIDTTPDISANCSLHSIKFKRSSQIVSIASGAIFTNVNKDLYLQTIRGSINNSQFLLNGHFSSFNGLGNLQPHLKMEGQIFYQDIATFFAGSSFIDSSPASISNKPILAQVFLFSYDKATKINFSTFIPDSEAADISFGNFTYKKFSNEPLSAKGVIILDGNKLSLGTSQIIMGRVTFQIAGSINEISGGSPIIDMKAWIHDPIPIQNVFDLLKEQNIAHDTNQITGSMRAGFHINGSISTPTLIGGCRIFAAGNPKLGINNVSGHLKISFINSTQDKIKNPVVTFALDNAYFGQINLKNITGSMTCSLDQEPAQIKISDLNGSLANGNLTASASIKLNDQLPFQTQIQMREIDSNEISKELGVEQNQFKGKSNIELNLNGLAQSPQDLIRSLSGTGNFVCANGHIAELSTLQKKLEEANLIEQGVVGFRISNVLGIVEPQENGQFTSASGQMEIDKGVVQLKEFTVEGQQLKLKSVGSIDLNTKQIVLHISGDIAHVGENGALGKVASLTSVAAVADLVSKGVRSKSPAPFASHPFVFEVNGYLDRPNTLDSSIVKSFHWTQISDIEQIKKAKKLPGLGLPL